MSNLIPLEEAAQMLGLSVDKLNEMRSNSEIFGYKDGTSWKFKMQEIERVASDLDVTLNMNVAADAADEVVELVDDEFEINLEDDDDDDLSFDLGDSGTDLIQPDSVEDDEDEIQLLDDDDDDEIQLLDDDEDEIQILEDVEEPADSAEEQGVLDLVDDDDDGIIDLEEDLPASEEIASLQDDDDDEISLIDDEEEEFVEKTVEAEVALEEEELSLTDDSEEDLAIASEADDFQLQDDSGEIEIAGDDEELSFGSSDIALAGGDEDGGIDDFELADSGPAEDNLMADDSDDVSELMLSEDDLFEDDLKIHESHEDDIDLSSDFEDSSDMIIEDSQSSEGAVIGDDDSDFMLEGDSAEIELSGSLMELAGADDDEMIVLDEPASAEVADDDFNLTPLEEVVDEESSGSQIIALEDSDMFSDESAATLLSPSDELEAAPMLSEDSLDVDDFGGFDAGLSGAAPGMAINPGAVGALPEQPYTVWQIVSLGLVMFLMLVGGMVGYDLARNLWLPDDQIISSGILPTILSLFGG